MLMLSIYSTITKLVCQFAHYVVATQLIYFNKEMLFSGLIYLKLSEISYSDFRD